MLRRTCLTLLGAILALTFGTAMAESKDGWETLFNGTDLSGWKLPEGAEDIWTIQDGVIDCMPRMDRKGDQSLYSEKSFGDFTLVLEWRLKETKGEYPMPNILPDGSYEVDGDGKPIITNRPNADSGIYLRGTPKAQINIWCWPIGSGEVWGYRTDPDVPAETRAACTPKVCADKPLGEWNTFEITLVGECLTARLNGQVVIDNAQLPGIPAEGPIALQHHGGYNPADDTWNSASSLVQFRNIRIKNAE